MKVTWDEAKNRRNKKRHGISFEEAQVLFTSGVRYLARFDAAHSDNEDRFLAIGPIAIGVISVVHTERGVDADETRIISARKATKQEIEDYRNFMEGE